MMMGFGLAGIAVFGMLIFWFVAIGLAIWLLGRLFPRSSGRAAAYNPTGNHNASMRDTLRGMAQPQRTDTSAVEILAQRYARGEITAAEYEEMRRTLGA
jgi:predicted lipid-binding transport protein (Tim44 family)